MYICYEICNSLILVFFFSLLLFFFLFITQLFKQLVNIPLHDLTWLLQNNLVYCNPIDMSEHWHEDIDQQSWNWFSIFIILAEPMRHPVASSCCRSLIGCRVCVAQWAAHEASCPRCRNQDFVSKKFDMTGMDEIVSIFRDTIRD